MNDLIPSFKDSVLNGSKDAIEDLTEVGIDKILDEGLLRDMPFVSLISGTIKTFHNLNDRNLLKQSLNFMREFKKGTIDEKKLEKYKKIISTDNKKAEEEFGRILLILNNTFETEKSSMFANYFRNYINGNINWNEFCELTEITRLLFVNDLEILERIKLEQIKDKELDNLYSIDRLNSLGLIKKNIAVWNAKSYLELSEFGERLLDSKNLS